MSLNLDPRQRAMLAKMGVRVWWSVAQQLPDVAQKTSDETIITIDSVAPDADSEGVAEPVNHQPRALSKTPRTNPQATPANTHLPAGINGMGWDELTLSVQNCQACAMGAGRRSAVLGCIPRHPSCDWMIVGDPPDLEQERAGTPFAAEAGQLLDQMLRAVGVVRCTPDTPTPARQQAYLSHVLKCRPALPRAPQRAELDQCAHFLRREIALIQPKVILAMGRFALQLLLSESDQEQQKLPLGKLRQQVWRFSGVPVVVTYPPSYLLRCGQDKASAWADLCLAQELAGV